MSRLLLIRQPNRYLGVNRKYFRHELCIFCDPSCRNDKLYYRYLDINGRIPLCDLHSNEKNTDKVSKKTQEIYMIKCTEYMCRIDSLDLYRKFIYRKHRTLAENYDNFIYLIIANGSVNIMRAEFNRVPKSTYVILYRIYLYYRTDMKNVIKLASNISVTKNRIDKIVSDVEFDYVSDLYSIPPWYRNYIDTITKVLLNKV